MEALQLFFKSPAAAPAREHINEQTQAHTLRCRCVQSGLICHLVFFLILISDSDLSFSLICRSVSNQFEVRSPQYPEITFLQSQLFRFVIAVKLEQTLQSLVVVHKLTRTRPQCSGLQSRPITRFKTDTRVTTRHFQVVGQPRYKLVFSDNLSVQLLLSGMTLSQSRGDQGQTAAKPILTAPPFQFILYHHVTAGRTIETERMDFQSLILAQKSVNNAQHIQMAFEHQ